MAAFALLTVVVALVAWAFIEPRILLVSRTTVVSPDVPPELDGARIVFLTDIHAGTLLGEGRVRYTVDRVNALEPDLIILGGDYIGGGGGQRGQAMARPHLSRLKAPMGVLAVLGNHEAGWTAEDVREQLLGGDAIVLENRSVRVGSRAGSMRVAGVGDGLSRRADLEAAATDIGRGEYAILVAHNPDTLATGLAQVPGAFDLTLSGHTHGGQVTLFGLWAPMAPTESGNGYLRGWHTIDGVPALVSRGTGVFMLPLRFFAPPEVHVLTLQRGAEPS